MFKKTILSIALACSLSLAVVNQAQAVLIAAFPVGGAMALVANVLGLGGPILAYKYGLKTSHKRAVAYGYLTLALVMDSDVSTMKFKPVDAKSASQIGITEEELESYNSESELERLNAAVEEATLDVQSKMETHTEVSRTEVFDSISAEVSPLTMSAVHKIMAASSVK